jgi:hypothetical protein
VWHVWVCADQLFGLLAVAVRWEDTIADAVGVVRTAAESMYQLEASNQNDRDCVVCLLGLAYMRLYIRVCMLFSVCVLMFWI